MVVIMFLRWILYGISVQLAIGGLYMLIAPVVHGEYHSQIIVAGVFILASGLALYKTAGSHFKSVTADAISKQYLDMFKKHSNRHLSVGLLLGISFLLTGYFCWMRGVPYNGSAWDVVSNKFEKTELCLLKTLPVVSKYDIYCACQVIESAGVNIVDGSGEYTAEEEEALDKAMEGFEMRSTASLWYTQFGFILLCGSLLTEYNMHRDYSILSELEG